MSFFHTILKIKEKIYQDATHLEPVKPDNCLDSLTAINLSQLKCLGSSPEPALPEELSI